MRSRSAPPSRPATASVGSGFAVLPPGARREIARYRGAGAHWKRNRKMNAGWVPLRHAKSTAWMSRTRMPLARRGRYAPGRGRLAGPVGGHARRGDLLHRAAARETWELAAEGLAATVPGAAPRAVDRAAGLRGDRARAADAGPRISSSTAGYTALIVGHNPGMAEITVSCSTAPPPTRRRRSRPRRLRCSGCQAAGRAM